MKKVFVHLFVLGMSVDMGVGVGVGAGAVSHNGRIVDVCHTKRRGHMCGSCSPDDGGINNTSCHSCAYWSRTLKNIKCADYIDLGNSGMPSCTSCVPQCCSNF